MMLSVGASVSSEDELLRVLRATNDFNALTRILIEENEKSFEGDESFVIAHLQSVFDAIGEEQTQWIRSCLLGEDDEEEAEDDERLLLRLYATLADVFGTRHTQTQSLTSLIARVVRASVAPRANELGARLASIAMPCGAVWSSSRLGSVSYCYHCSTCETDPTCAVCVDCFQPELHRGHRYRMVVAGGGCCDCGDVTAWAVDGMCDRHRPKTASDGDDGDEDDKDGAVEVLPALPTAARRLLRLAAAVAARAIVVDENFDLLLHLQPLIDEEAMELPLYKSIYAELTTDAARRERRLLATAARHPLPAPLHSWLLQCLTTVKEFKRIAGRALVQNYDNALASYVAVRNDDVRQHLFIEISVQIFTLPSLALELCRDTDVDLAGMLFHSLYAIFDANRDEQRPWLTRSRVWGPDDDDDDDDDDGGDGDASANERRRTHDRLWRALTDCRYLLSSPAVVQYVAHAPELRRHFFDLLFLWHGIDAIKHLREHPAHDEFASHLAFNFTLTFDKLVHAMAVGACVGSWPLLPATTSATTEVLATRGAAAANLVRTQVHPSVAEFLRALLQSFILHPNSQTTAPGRLLLGTTRVSCHLVAVRQLARLISLLSLNYSDESLKDGSLLVESLLDNVESASLVARGAVHDVATIYALRAMMDADYFRYNGIMLLHMMSIYDGRFCLHHQLDNIVALRYLITSLAAANRIDDVVGIFAAVFSLDGDDQLESDESVRSFRRALVRERELYFFLCLLTSTAPEDVLVEADARVRLWVVLTLAQNVARLGMKAIVDALPLPLRSYTRTREIVAEMTEKTAVGGSNSNTLHGDPSLRLLPSAFDAHFDPITCHALCPRQHVEAVINYAHDLRRRRLARAFYAPRLPPQSPLTAGVRRLFDSPPFIQLLLDSLSTHEQCYSPAMQLILVGLLHLKDVGKGDGDVLLQALVNDDRFLRLLKQMKANQDEETSELRALALEIVSVGSQFPLLARRFASAGLSTDAGEGDGNGDGAGAASAPPTASSSSSAKKKENSKAARRRAAILNKFKQQQQSFQAKMEEEEEVEEAKEVSISSTATESLSSPLSVDNASTTASSLDSDDPSMTTKKARVDGFEEEGDEDNVICVVCRSSQTLPGNELCVATCTLLSSALHDSSGGDQQQLVHFYRGDDSNIRADLRTLWPTDNLGEDDTESLKRIGAMLFSALEETSFVRCSSCSHFIHQDCARQIKANVRTQQLYDATADSIGETVFPVFLCPLCKGLINCLMPVEATVAKSTTMSTTTRSMTPAEVVAKIESEIESIGSSTLPCSPPPLGYSHSENLDIYDRFVTQLLLRQHGAVAVSFTAAEHLLALLNTFVGAAAESCLFEDINDDVEVGGEKQLVVSDAFFGAQKSMARRLHAVLCAYASPSLARDLLASLLSSYRTVRTEAYAFVARASLLFGASHDGVLQDAACMLRVVFSYLLFVPFASLNVAECNVLRRRLRRLLVDMFGVEELNFDTQWERLMSTTTVTTTATAMSTSTTTINAVPLSLLPNIASTSVFACFRLQLPNHYQDRSFFFKQYVCCEFEGDGEGEEQVPCSRMSTSVGQGNHSGEGGYPCLCCFQCGHSVCMYHLAQHLDRHHQLSNHCLFIEVASSRIAIINRSLQGVLFWLRASVYVDEHDQQDLNLRRGLPLHLSTIRYKKLLFFYTSLQINGLI